MKQLDRWIIISLVNLAIVALLGLTLRLKIIFSIPFLDFKYILHAHSHYAFGGWVTLALLSLLTFRVLPVQFSARPVYKWLLTGILLSAVGMLISFPLQGYAFFSILFSTLFIFASYGFAYAFIRDLLKTETMKSVKVLLISAMVSLVLSSVGAFTLAYLLATHSSNLFLYKDAIYTYLHLQYNGFFSLTILGLILHYFKQENRFTRTFSSLIVVSIIPSMFMSYLWHDTGWLITVMAVAGSLLTVISCVTFIIMVRSISSNFNRLKPLARNIAAIAVLCFATKLVLQAITIIPSLGHLVFSNRPVIIGFLHLVLLGFVSLFLLAYFIQAGLLPDTKRAAIALSIFIGGVILNEVVLMTQGLGIMLMITSSIANWLLLLAAACLFSGALLIVFTKLRSSSSAQLSAYQSKTFRLFSQT